MTIPKELFLLDPKIVFLNHGSFGACPKSVFEVYQEWQRELERQPVEFLGRRITGLLVQARSGLATFLGVEADDLVYFSNPTTALNMAARGLNLQAGDEILSTNHEYGAMERMWRLLCEQRGARFVQTPIPLPVTNHEEILARLWAGVTERTKAIFISHITSPTALILPVEAICHKARQAGILTIVDGAHAPGQLSLNLAEVGADIYAGACHKWLCAPKGAGFLYARQEAQSRLLPLVVSWGYESETPSASRFVDYHEWQGTRDFAAALSVPAAIQFQEKHNWDSVRQACHALASQVRRRIQALTGLEQVCPDSPNWYRQMFTIRMPENTDLVELKTRLYEDYQIEVPVIDWQGQKLLRVSIQGYNTLADTDALLEALSKLLQPD